MSESDNNIWKLTSFATKMFDLFRFSFMFDVRQQEISSCTWKSEEKYVSNAHMICESQNGTKFIVFGKRLIKEVQWNKKNEFYFN